MAVRRTGQRGCAGRRRRRLAAAVAGGRADGSAAAVVANAMGTPEGTDGARERCGGDVGTWQRQGMGMAQQGSGIAALDNNAEMGNGTRLNGRRDSHGQDARGAGRARGRERGEGAWRQQQAQEAWQHSSRVDAAGHDDGERTWARERVHAAGGGGQHGAAAKRRQSERAWQMDDSR